MEQEGRRLTLTVAEAWDGEKVDTLLRRELGRLWQQLRLWQRLWLRQRLWKQQLLLSKHKTPTGAGAAGGGL